MINKSSFIKYINRLKELSDISNAINTAGNKLESFTITFSEHEQLIVDILEDAFDDKECNWISYFIYDLEFGSKWRENCITMDGVDVRMSNTGELYDVLIENLERK